MPSTGSKVTSRERTQSPLRRPSDGHVGAHSDAAVRKQSPLRSAPPPIAKQTTLQKDVPSRMQSHNGSVSPVPATRMHTEASLKVAAPMTAMQKQSGAAQAPLGTTLGQTTNVPTSQRQGPAYVQVPPCTTVGQNTNVPTSQRQGLKTDTSGSSFTGVALTPASASPVLRQGRGSKPAADAEKQAIQQATRIQGINTEKSTPRLDARDDFEGRFANITLVCNSTFTMMKSLQDMIKKQEGRLEALETQHVKQTSNSPERTDSDAIHDLHRDVVLLSDRMEQKFAALEEQSTQVDHQVRLLSDAVSKQTLFNDEVHRQFDSVSQLKEQSSKIEDLAKILMKELDEMPQLATRLQSLEAKEWRRSIILKPEAALEDGQLRSNAQVESKVGAFCQSDLQTMQSRLEQLESILGVNLSATKKDACSPSHDRLKSLMRLDNAISKSSESSTGGPPESPLPSQQLFNMLQARDKDTDAAENPSTSSCQSHSAVSTASLGSIPEEEDLDDHTLQNRGLAEMAKKALDDHITLLKMSNQRFRSEQAARCAEPFIDTEDGRHKLEKLLGDALALSTRAENAINQSACVPTLRDEDI